MIKIKVRIPDNDNYPEKYRGKEVFIEFTTFKFPDGIYWSIEGLTNQPELVIEKNVEQEKQKTINDFFKQELASLNIEFKNDRTT